MNNGYFSFWNINNSRDTDVGFKILLPVGIFGPYFHKTIVILPTLLSMLSPI